MDKGFNMTRARMVVRNPETYDPAHVRAAAVWLLGSLSATQEDILDASACLSRAKSS